MARYGKKNSAKFVFTKELGILLGVIVAMIVATVLLSIPNKTDRQIESYNESITAFNTLNQTQYATIIDDETVYIDAEYEDFNEILKNEGNVYVLYGTLNLDSICSNFVTIDNEAKQREIEEVYFLSSKYVDSFVDNPEDDDDEDIFEANVKSYEAILNANVLEGIEEIDLDVTGALFVFNNGQLVFNSTSYTDYNWSQIINQAFQK